MQPSIVCEVEGDSCACSCSGDSRCEQHNMQIIWRYCRKARLTCQRQFCASGLRLLSQSSAIGCDADDMPATAIAHLTLADGALFSLSFRPRSYLHMARIASTMNFPCNQGIAGVHEGQVHASRSMAGWRMTAFAPHRQGLDAGACYTRHELPGPASALRLAGVQQAITGFGGLLRAI